MKKLLKTLFIALFVGKTAVFCTATDWKKAQPDYVWSFPRDHAAHRLYQTEWWYFTGHLVSTDGSHQFGYQFTFFRVGLSQEKVMTDSQWSTQGLIMGHAAITDVTDQKHTFSHMAYRESPLFGEFNEKPLAWTVAAPGSDGKWTLDWNGNGFDFSMADTSEKMGFDLSTIPKKPLIFQGPNGFSQKSNRSDAASLYYSFTRLETKGRVVIQGTTYTVVGQSWMDKEFSSNQLDENQSGWDWFSLQLNDGRELMLYVLRDENNQTDFSRGSVISANANRSQGVRYISDKDWNLKVTNTWTSSSNAQYPSRWKLSIPSEKMDMVITPLVADQENRGTGPGLPYWEGAVKIEDEAGDVIGKGFVELTGYLKEKKLRF